MYELNGICYAGTPTEEPRIIEAKPLVGHMLLVEFQSGERRLFDATQLTGTAFNPLKDDAVFEKVTIFHGVPTWADGEIDIAPEYVYDHSVTYDETNILGRAG